MSKILDIYTEIGNLTITAGGKTPKVYELGKTPQKLDSVQLPARIQLPVAVGNSEGRGGRFIAIGNRITIDWQVYDLFLWKSVVLGKGIEEHAPVIVEYLGNFIDAIKEKRFFADNQATVEEINLQNGIYEYPQGSGTWYAGVLANLTVKEVI